MQVTLHYGYMESPRIPNALAVMRKAGLKFDIMTTSFFVGRRTLKASRDLRHAAMAGQTVHRDDQTGRERPGLLPDLRPTAWSSSARR